MGYGFIRKVYALGYWRFTLVKRLQLCLYAPNFASVRCEAMCFGDALNQAIRYMISRYFWCCCDGFAVASSAKMAMTRYAKSDIQLTDGIRVEGSESNLH